ncbi:MAG: RHS repeat protein, partial [Gammaproteobacteria bacterium]|nr:RHS repeat protein [Gammaproteobacteria bacterium]
MEFKIRFLTGSMLPVFAGLTLFVSMLSVSQAALICPNNNAGRPCSLAEAFETCETYIDRYRIPHGKKRCKTRGDTSCNWCGGSSAHVAIYYWTPWGTPGWTFLSPIFWVRGNQPDAGKNLGKPEFCPEGNPINQATGNKFQLETDYDSPVAGGLNFRRYYNSLAPTHGSLGTHWRSTYDRRLDTRYHESTLTMIREDGKRHLFWQPNAGGWQGEPDVTHRLEALHDTLGNLNGWEYQSSLDIHEVYDLQGRLRAITDRAGRSQTLDYDTDNRLATVTGPFGRVLRFDYDAENRLVWMTDPGGGRYRYDYDSQGNLVSVRYPDATTRQYVYQDPQHVHALSGIIDERGVRLSRWAYDAQGRAIMSEHADGAERVDLRYNADDTTTVTDALGASRRYAFTTQHGVIKPTRILGDQCSGCGDLAQSYNYDSNGYLEAKTDRN